MEKNPQPHRHRHDRLPQHHYERPPRPEELLDDMMALAEVFLGPQFDDDQKQSWYTQEDQISASGLAVTDGNENYFIYGESTILPYGSKEAYRGLKRVIFDSQPGRKHLKLSVSTQAYRKPEDEFKP